MMNKNANINYIIKNFDRLFDLQQKVTLEQCKFEKRLAKCVIGYLYRFNRKALKNLDRSDFGMLMHNAAFDEEKRLVHANLWFTTKNEDGTTTDWCETFVVNIEDLKH